MPQNAVPIFTVSEANSSPLQEPINLQTGGNLVIAGAPGNPVVFGLYGRVMIPGLAGSSGRSVTHGRYP